MAFVLDRPLRRYRLLRITRNSYARARFPLYSYRPGEKKDRRRQETSSCSRQGESAAAILLQCAAGRKKTATTFLEASSRQNGAPPYRPLKLPPPRHCGIQGHTVGGNFVRSMSSIGAARGVYLVLWISNSGILSLVQVRSLVAGVIYLKSVIGLACTAGNTHGPQSLSVAPLTCITMHSVPYILPGESMR